MSFAFKTNNSIIVDNNSFFIGTTGFSTNIYSSEVGIITASDGAAGDDFGASVAVGSGKIVVGARNDVVGSNADQGSAYIYDINAGIGTTENKKILASDGAANDHFGDSVAAGSGRIVVGASQNNNQGSAYIFDLNGNQLGIITASDVAAGGEFGYSVAVGSGRIVVGAPSDDVGSNNAQGSAYIFDLNGNQLGIITASDGAAGDFFGFSVAVGSGRIVVGAIADDVGSNVAQGSAYIFDLNGNQLGIITASDGSATDLFGNSVAVGCGRIVVGAYSHDVGSNGNQGSAYIFDLNGNQLGIITASDGNPGDNFGISVAVGNGRIVVGARYDDIGSNNNQGSAYIFDLDGNQLGIITASNGAASDYFGQSVAVGSGKIVVGSRDVAVNTQGSAYIYDTPKQTHFLDQLDGR